MRELQLSIYVSKAEKPNMYLTFQFCSVLPFMTHFITFGGLSYFNTGKVKIGFPEKVSFLINKLL